MIHGQLVAAQGGVNRVNPLCRGVLVNLDQAVIAADHSIGHGVIQDRVVSVEDVLAVDLLPEALRAFIQALVALEDLFHVVAFL